MPRVFGASFMGPRGNGGKRRHHRRGGGVGNRIRTTRNLSPDENLLSGWFGMLLRHGEDAGEPGGGDKHILGTPLEELRQFAPSGFVPWEKFLMPAFLKKHPIHNDAGERRPCSIKALCKYSINGDGEHRFEYFKSKNPGTKLQHYVRARTNNDWAVLQLEEPEEEYWEGKYKELKMQKHEDQQLGSNNNDGGPDAGSGSGGNGEGDDDGGDHNNDPNHEGSMDDEDHDGMVDPDQFVHNDRDDSPTLDHDGKMNRLAGSEGHGREVVDHYSPSHNPFARQNNSVPMGHGNVNMSGSSSRGRANRSRDQGRQQPQRTNFFIDHPVTKATGANETPLGPKRF
ncbi:unnamed protein product [Amoebophrya sp. A120]|nr:unnamed protein product [Amoebophrya sp. A120]|eukprot:GSA120T00022569001.1